MYFHADFPADFSCQKLKETPHAQINSHDYPSGLHSYAELVLIEPNQGEHWIGRFSFVNLFRSRLSSAFSTPNKNSVLIVVDGCGYLININNPPEYHVIEADPIEKVIPFKKSNILVLVSHTNLFGIGPQGIQWKSVRVHW